MADYPQVRPSARRRQRGQAALEFALVAPVVVLMLMALIEFGLILSTKQTMQYAVREGGRVATGMRGTDDQRLQQATTTVNTICRTFQPQLTMGFAGVWPDRTMTLEAHYDMPVVVPVISAITGNPFPLDTVIVMRVEE